MSKIKEHWNNHKEKYLIGAGALAVGVGVGLYFRQVQISVSNPALLSWKPVANTLQIQISRPGNPAHVIQCNETGTVWSSIRSAASELGLNPGEISKNVKGLTDDVNGYTFTKIAEV